MGSKVPLRKGRKVETSVRTMGTNLEILHEERYRDYGKHPREERNCVVVLSMYREI